MQMQLVFENICKYAAFENREYANTKLFLQMHICKYALVAQSANMQIWSFCGKQICKCALASQKNTCKYFFVFCKTVSNMQIRVAGAKREYANMQLLRTMSTQARACFFKNSEYANMRFCEEIENMQICSF